jgi:hypothetical protein
LRGIEDRRDPCRIEDSALDVARLGSRRRITGSLCGTVSFGLRMPSRWLPRRSVLAIVAALALVAAVLGCGAVHAQMAALASQSSSAAPSASPDSGPTQLHSAAAPVRRLGVGSTVNDDKAFRSAGLKRDRATTLALSTPRWSDSATPPSVGTVRSEQRSDTPAGRPICRSVVHNLLIQFCVARC